jgi:hypothetical protein
MNLYRIMSDYNQTVRFNTTLPLDVAIGRLSTRVQSLTLAMRVASDVGKSTLVGSLTKNAVVLQRVQPLTGNFFKPRFYGSFTSKNEETLLEGRFSMAPFTIFVVCSFFLCLAVAEIVMLPLAFSPSAHMLLIFSPGMAALLLGLVYSGRWAAKDDPMWISKAINDRRQRSVA